MRSTGVTSSPVPLPAWLSEVGRSYAAKENSTRHRTLQAATEAAALAGPDATTADLTPSLVDRYARTKLATGARAATTTGLLSGLRAACSIAVERGWLDFSPFLDWNDWPSPDDIPLRSRAFSRSEIARVLALLAERSAGSWHGGRLQALAATWAYSGLRYNEALRLRVSDLDFEASTIRVKRPVGRKLKTRRSEAIVPMCDALASILAGWLPRSGAGPWIFPGVKGLGPWAGGKSGYRPGECLTAAAAELGIGGMTPHTLRHSLATHLRGHWGLPPGKVQLILRHSNQQMQDHYLQEDRDNLVAMVRNVRYDLP